MRKIAIFIIALVIFISVGLVPWIDGTIFKKNYLNMVEAINHYHHVKIEVLNYQQGWFTSSAKIRVTPLSGSAQQPSPFVSFIIINSISHGPLVTDKAKNSLTFAYASIQSLVHFPVEFAAFNKGPLNPIEINTIFSFNHEWLNQFTIPSLALTLPGSGKLMWQGLSGNVDFHVVNKQITQSHIDMQVGALSLDGNNENSVVSTANIQAFSYQSEAWRQADGLWKGNTTLSLPGVKVIRPDGSNIEASQFKLISSVDGQSAAAYQFNLQIGMQKLHVPNDIIADVSDFNLSLIVNNVNMQVARELQNLIASLQTNGESDTQQAYLALLPHLINANTTVNQKLTMNTPLGRLLSTVNVSWPANTPMPATLSDMASKTSMTINIRAASTLIDKLIESFDKLMSAYSSSVKPPQQQPVTPVAPQPAPAVATDSKNAYNLLVAQLLQQGEITLPQSLELIGFFDAHNTAQQYAENIDKMGLQANTVMLLKQQYQFALNKMATATTQNPPVPATAPTPTPTPVATPVPVSVSPQQSEEALLKQQIADWIQQGFIIRDNNDYVISITHENGVTTVNGKALPPEALPPT